jgi:hypothetical protein
MTQRARYDLPFVRRVAFAVLVALCAVAAHQVTYLLGIAEGRDAVGASVSSLRPRSPWPSSAPTSSIACAARCIMPDATPTPIARSPRIWARPRACGSAWRS